MKNFYRDTWAEIDLSAIYYNMTEIRKVLSQDVNIFAAVKANGYGHGSLQVAKTVLAAGANGLLVAMLDEALFLRKKGIEAPILVLGVTRPEDAGVAAKENISLTVFQLDWVKKAEPYIPDHHPLHVHIKCDTGMNRIGLKEESELKELESYLLSSPYYYFEGIFTHFATADQLNREYYQKQVERFQQFLKCLTKIPPYIHASNSAATLVQQDAIFNTVRIGIALYGLTPSEEIQPLLPFPLKEAFSLHTKIVHIKKMTKGEKVSYGTTYTAEKEEWLATIPIGYGDGWLRRLQGIKVLVDGKKFPIVGRICMDQCMIALPEYKPTGTLVTLIGEQNGANISVNDIAKKLETINYEVTCIISSRVPRIYKINGKQITSEHEIFAENLKKIAE